MRSRERLLFAIGICLALACPAVYAQNEPSAAPSPEPRRMVTLNVRVTDSHNHAVADVSQDAFSVTEDGVAQKILYFSKEVVPLSYGLLIDNSGSLRSQLSGVIQTGAAIVNSNKEHDETFIIRLISINKFITVLDFTSNKRLLMEGLASLYVEGGQTALIDALYLSVDKLAKRQTADKLQRLTLILITDGEERSSFYKPEQLFKVLAHNDIQIYAVGFTGELKDGKKKRAVELLTRLATDTGGRVFFPRSPADLGHVANEIISDIRTQYLIGYVPSGDGPKGSFHKVKVSIANNPENEKRIAITRVGYSAYGKY